MTIHPINEKSGKFALQCIQLYKKLTESGEYILSKQLLRSGTSIGANIAEAQAGQSKKDFFAKICIAFKEAHETKYWLHLLKEGQLTTENLEEIEHLCQELIAMLSAIKISTQKNMNAKPNS